MDALKINERLLELLDAKDAEISSIIHSRDFDLAEAQSKYEEESFITTKLSEEDPEIAEKIFSIRNEYRYEKGVVPF